MLDYLKSFKDEFTKAMSENSTPNGAAKAPQASQAQNSPDTRGDQYSSMIHCPRCESVLHHQTKFCPECGLNISEGFSTIQGTQAQQQSPQLSQEELQAQIDALVEERIQALRPESPQREQQFAGMIQKCPNCGEIINPTDAVCNSCGFKITGRNSSSVVQQFSEGLMQIEKSRPSKNALDEIVRSVFGSDDARVIAESKAEFIRSFPVPNTIEELTEFMFMAEANISVKHSKKKTFWSTNYEGTAEKIVSDAWVAKMQQIYKKAKLSFSDDPVFLEIEETYARKTAELGFE